MRKEEKKVEENSTHRKCFWTKKKLLFLDFFLILLLVLLDQTIKYFVSNSLEQQGSIVLWEGVLQLTYLKNSGGILGFLQNQTPFILFIVGILLLVILYLLTKLPDKPRFIRLHPVLSCLLAGAVGNMVDRLRFGYVIDFIYFVGIEFPIFNTADILISVSTVVLILLLLFYYKEKDLEFLTFKQKRYRELK